MAIQWYKYSKGIGFCLSDGFRFAVFNIDMPLWVSDLSAPGQHARTLKNYQILYSAGGIVFSSVPGMIADRTGEYRTSYTVFGLLLLVSIVILTTVYNSKAAQSGER